MRKIRSGRRFNAEMQTADLLVHSKLSDLSPDHWFWEVASRHLDLALAAIEDAYDAVLADEHRPKDPVLDAEPTVRP